MSWGFFCDIALTVPSADWKRLWKSKTQEHALPSPLFGFEDADLEEMFTICRDHSDRQPDVALKDLTRWFKSYSGTSSITEDAKAGTTTFRGTMIIDRGADPWIAKTVAALLLGSRATATGQLALINDGSYVGESGVVLQLANGELTTTRIADSRPAQDALGRALFEGGQMPSPAELVALATGARAKKAAAPAKKTVATKPAPKKAAPSKKSGAARR